MQGPVIVLGAGATKACNGPLTNEILHEAFTQKVMQEIQREDFFPTLEPFLVHGFHVPGDRMERRQSDYPPLPLLMSLLDTAIDRGQPMPPIRNPADLRRVRESLEYVIFAVLEYKLRRLQQPTPHQRMLELLYPPPAEPQVISLNYDIIVDNVMAAFSEHRGPPCLPDYCCDIQTELYKSRPHRFGKLLKLHGSLNWLYCPGCQRLEVAVSRSGRSFAKALEELYSEQDAASGDLDHRYTCHGSPCTECGVFVRPVMITPTQKKDYRNPHIATVWYEADRMLRHAGSAIFVGYSLPDDDVEVAYLMKRGLSHLPPEKITVIEYDEPPRALRDNPVGQRYRSLFGDGINWQPCGFLAWVEREEHAGAQGARSGI